MDKVLIIIPAYNEEENIERVVDNLVKNYPQYDYLVVNDGSKDATLQICKDRKYNYLDLSVNLGLAGGFQTGMKYALRNQYDMAIQFDGDGQHRPEYIDTMVEVLKKENADIVIGSRFVSEKKPKSLRMLGSNLISSLVKITTKKKVSDPTSGMRLFNKKMIELFATSMNYGPEPDTLSYLIRSGCKVVEVQVEMDDRIAGESYLNLKNSILYMSRMCTSIILIQWYRNKR